MSKVKELFIHVTVGASSTSYISPSGAVTCEITVPEAKKLVEQIAAKIDALKVKCSGCRCRIFPGATCYCCAEYPVTDDD